MLPSGGFTLSMRLALASVLPLWLVMASRGSFSRFLSFFFHFVTKVVYWHCVASHYFLMLFADRLLRDIQDNLV